MIILHVHTPGPTLNCLGPLFRTHFPDWQNWTKMSTGSGTSFYVGNMKSEIINSLFGFYSKQTMILSNYTDSKIITENNVELYDNYFIVDVSSNLSKRHIAFFLTGWTQSEPVKRAGKILKGSFQWGLCSSWMEEWLKTGEISRKQR